MKRKQERYRYENLTAEELESEITQYRCAVEQAQHDRMYSNRYGDTGSRLARLSDELQALLFAQKMLSQPKDKAFDAAWEIVSRHIMDVPKLADMLREHFGGDAPDLSEPEAKAEVEVAAQRAAGPVTIELIAAPAQAQANAPALEEIDFGFA